MSFIGKKKPLFSYKPFKTNKQIRIEFVHENLVTFFEWNLLWFYFTRCRMIPSRFTRSTRVSRYSWRFTTRTPYESSGWPLPDQSNSRVHNIVLVTLFLHRPIQNWFFWAYFNESAQSSLALIPLFFSSYLVNMEGGFFCVCAYQHSTIFLRFLVKFNKIFWQNHRQRCGLIINFSALI